MARISLEAIAETCHEANRVLCNALGDDSQLLWAAAPDWQKQSAVKGVMWRLLNPGATASAQHDQWLADKEADGWVYGETKDPDKKTHPCMVTYDQLPQEQRVKDELFVAIVNAMRALT